MDKASLDRISQLQGLPPSSEAAASEIGRELARFQATLRQLSPVSAFDDQPSDFRAVQLRDHDGQ